MIAALRGSRWLREGSDSDVLFIRDLAEDVHHGLLISSQGEFLMELEGSVDGTKRTLYSPSKLSMVVS